MAKVVTSLFINLIYFILINSIFTIIYMLIGKNHFSGFDDKKSYDFLDWFYLSCTTTSTVGYGDHYPTTKVSKIIVIIHQLFILSNIASLTTPLIDYIYSQPNNFRHYPNQFYQQM